jgi:hypothetical protein
MIGRKSAAALLALMLLAGLLVGCSTTPVGDDLTLWNVASGRKVRSLRGRSDRRAVTLRGGSGERTRILKGGGPPEAPQR